MGPKEDLTGRTFHWLTVEGLSNEKIGKNISRLCRCKCGNVVVRTTGHLNEKTLHSCGCRGWQYHHQVGTHFYRKYQDAKNRCNNFKVTSYKYYGGRGIKFLWKSFEEFRDDMYESYLNHVKEYGEKNTTIDRIDSNGDYCKENCRWATIQEQINNRRNMDSIEYKGKFYSRRELEVILGMSKGSIGKKLRRGVPIGWIIDNPHKRYTKKYV